MYTFYRRPGSDRLWHEAVWSSALAGSAKNSAKTLTAADMAAASPDLATSSCTSKCSRSSRCLAKFPRINVGSSRKQKHCVNVHRTGPSSLEFAKTPFSNNNMSMLCVGTGAEGEGPSSLDTCSAMPISCKRSICFCERNESQCDTASVSCPDIAAASFTTSQSDGSAVRFNCANSKRVRQLTSTEWQLHRKKTITHRSDGSSSEFSADPRTTVSYNSLPDTIKPYVLYHRPLVQEVKRYWLTRSNRSLVSDISDLVSYGDHCSKFRHHTRADVAQSQPHANVVRQINSTISRTSVSTFLDRCEAVSGFEEVRKASVGNMLTSLTASRPPPPRRLKATRLPLHRSSPSLSASNRFSSQNWTNDCNTRDFVDCALATIECTILEEIIACASSSYSHRSVEPTPGHNKENDLPEDRCDEHRSKFAKLNAYWKSVQEIPRTGAVPSEDKTVNDRKARRSKLIPFRFLNYVSERKRRNSSVCAERCDSPEALKSTMANTSVVLTEQTITNSDQSNPAVLSELKTNITDRHRSNDTIKCHSAGREWHIRPGVVSQLRSQFEILARTA